MAGGGAGAAWWVAVEAPEELLGGAGAGAGVGAGAGGGAVEVRGLETERPELWRGGALVGRGRYRRPLGTALLLAEGAGGLRPVGAAEYRLVFEPCNPEGESSP